MHGVGHDQQFHQVIVGWFAHRLHQIDITTTHIFNDLDHDLAIAESSDGALAQRYIEVAGGILGQSKIRVTGEQHHIGEGHDLKTPALIHINKE